MPAARHVEPGENIIHALSFASSILLVEISTTTSGANGARLFECRGCISLAPDCTKTARLFGASAVLEHLDEHRKQGHAGAKDAIWKLEACAECRGAGTLGGFLRQASRCETCGGSGKNAAGKDRGVRRGVVVG